MPIAPSLPIPIPSPSLSPSPSPSLSPPPSPPPPPLLQIPGDPPLSFVAAWAVHPECLGPDSPPSLKKFFQLFYALVDIPLSPPSRAMLSSSSSKTAADADVAAASGIGVDGGYGGGKSPGNWSLPEHLPSSAWESSTDSERCGSGVGQGKNFWAEACRPWPEGGRGEGEEEERGGLRARIIASLCHVINVPFMRMCLFVGGGGGVSSLFCCVCLVFLCISCLIGVLSTFS